MAATTSPPFASPLMSCRKARNPPAIVILLQMCHNFHEVRQVHGQLVVSGLLHRPLNGGRLVESYVRVSQTQYALSIFGTIPSPDIFAYNTIMRGLMSGKDPFSSLLMYNKLLKNGLIPDNYTYTFVLKACSKMNALIEGKQVHCQMIKAGIPPDTHVYSSLINMYASSGSIAWAERVLGEFKEEENTLAKNAMISGYLSQGHVDKARAMFDKMVTKDVASWSAMIVGYRDNAMYKEALCIVREMVAFRVSPNESALVSALSACGHLGALDQGRWIHAYVDKNRVELSITLGTALVDMYAKCGCIESCYEVFRKLPHRDVVTWGAVISGFAIHGKPEKCFQLFGEMVSEGVQPNEVVFVAILSACSHAGCVELGFQYFHQMVHDFGIVPLIEHYGCMVDLLGRAGRLAEAKDFILAMPEKPNSIIWGAFLSACRMHNDPERGKLAFKRLMELEPRSGDRYKLARLMFGNAGELENARMIRKFIDENDMETTRGLSFIEVDGVLNEFMAGSIDHDRHREIYRLWEGVDKSLENQ